MNKQPARQPNTDHYIDSHFSCESKTHTKNKGKKKQKRKKKSCFLVKTGESQVFLLTCFNQIWWFMRFQTCYLFEPCKYLSLPVKSWCYFTIHTCEIKLILLLYHPVTIHGLCWHHGSGGYGFFLMCKDFRRMSNKSFANCAFCLLFSFFFSLLFLNGD